MPVYLHTIMVLPVAAGALFPACASAEGAAAMAAGGGAAGPINLGRENFIDHSTRKFDSMVTKMKGRDIRALVIYPIWFTPPFSPPCCDRSGSAAAHPHFPRGQNQDRRG